VKDLRDSEKEKVKRLIRKKKEAIALFCFLTYSVKASNLISEFSVLLLLSSFIWSLTECSFKKPL